ncbi:AIM2 [Acrasis kona]|uniref:AIM2 n=1 Tax=Acrasis kona TaxID=1008807 RepID=A0AAW2Z5D4_9EUKA
MDQCCAKGSLHTGSPVGKVVELFSVLTYVTKSNGPTKHAILLLSDAIGHTFINAQLAADTFAELGNVDVFIPDIVNGEGIPVSYLSGEKYDVAAWVSRHPKETCRHIIFDAARSLKSDMGYEKIGVVGYCFGGWGTLELGASDLVNAVAVAHPSLLNFPADVENLKQPALFLCAEVDQQFPLDKVERSKQITSEKALDNKFVFYPGTEHGFAMRFNMKSPVVVKAAEDAKDQVIDWFYKHFK